MSDPKWSRLISQPANRDIYEILLYTREMWSLEQVDIYELALLEGLERIRSFPEAGSPVFTVDSGIRKCQVRHHVIYYTVDEDLRQLTVLRILHERRRVTRDLLTEQDD